MIIFRGGIDTVKLENCMRTDKGIITGLVEGENTVSLPGLSAGVERNDFCSMKIITGELN
jgi:hypothetical protein